MDGTMMRCHRRLGCNTPEDCAASDECLYCGDDRVIDRITGTLDLPQHVYACHRCAATGIDAIIASWCEHDLGLVATLTPADVDAHIATLPHPQPDPLAVWDRLERVTDTAETNREAIDNAIRAVAR